MRSWYQTVIKVLGLALYGPLAASTRYRLGQYIDGLRREGIDLRISSLLGDEYLRRRFSRSRLPFATLLEAGWRRFRELRDRDFDLSIVHCELFPFMPGWLEHMLLDGKPCIYDFDDAFYLKYRDGRLGAFRPVLGGKFDAVMRGAAAITAGNADLARYARALNPGVVQLPTVVDTARYLPALPPRNDIFTIGWVGSPSTAPYLDMLRKPLQALAAESPVRLVVIGGVAQPIPGVDVVCRAWDESTEVASIQSFDVGVMPLPDSAWARGKCAFKLIQYMACGVAVVGSRVGANVAVVAPGTGFLPDTPQGWVEALRVLRDDRQLARRMGESARARIEDHYSLAVNLPVLAGVIHTIHRAGG